MQAGRLWRLTRSIVIDCDDCCYCTAGRDPRESACNKPHRYAEHRRSRRHGQCILCRAGADPLLLVHHLAIIIQSPQARKPLDRMCVHAGDGQTYLSGVDSMS